MKRLGIFISLVALLGTFSCTHKELCINHPEHALRYHINLVADYHHLWEEHNQIDWPNNWPEGYLPYEQFIPGKPTGLRVINTNADGQSNTHNIGPDGGVVNLYEGYNDLLAYNNDTEYIVFLRADNGATTRATTRTRTRASYLGNQYANEKAEETVTPPDMLYSTFLQKYEAEKLIVPADVNVDLHPLVFTYKVRYEFESGLEYVAIARGAISGMAVSVTMNTGVTSDEAATILYDCEVTDFGARAIVKSFGLPGFPNPNFKSSTNKNALNLEVMLKNGKIVVREFDITDQVKAQPHGGVIVVKGIVITEEEGMQGTGSFDVEVNDWGEYQDIIIPL